MIGLIDNAAVTMNKADELEQRIDRLEKAERRRQRLAWKNNRKRGKRCTQRR